MDHTFTQDGDQLALKYVCHTRKCRAPLTRTTSQCDRHSSQVTLTSWLLNYERVQGNDLNRDMAWLAVLNISSTDGCRLQNHYIWLTMWVGGCMISDVRVPSTYNFIAADGLVSQGASVSPHAITYWPNLVNVKYGYVHSYILFQSFVTFIMNLILNFWSEI